MSSSFCGSHPDVGVENVAHAASDTAHKVTIELRDTRLRSRPAGARPPSLRTSLFALLLDALSFVTIALFARYGVVSNMVAGLLVGGVVGARLAGCRLRHRARAFAASAVVLLGFWAVLSCCTGR